MWFLLDLPLHAQAHHRQMGIPGFQFQKIGKLQNLVSSFNFTLSSVIYLIRIYMVNSQFFFFTALEHQLNIFSIPHLLKIEVQQNKLKSSITNMKHVVSQNLAEIISSRTSRTCSFHLELSLIKSTAEKSIHHIKKSQATLIKGSFHYGKISS